MSRVEVLLDASSFTSNNAKRDKDVRSAPLLNVATYPDITFESGDLRQEGDQWKLSGTVTAHGSAVPVEVIIEELTFEAVAFGSTRVRPTSTGIASASPGRRASSADTWT